MERGNMRVVSALIPWDITQKLDQLSELEGRSKAWIIRLALADYLAKAEELDQFIQEGMDSIARWICGWDSSPGSLPCRLRPWCSAGPISPRWNTPCPHAIASHPYC